MKEALHRWVLRQRRGAVLLLLPLALLLVIIVALASMTLILLTRAEIRKEALETLALTVQPPP